MLPLPHLVAHKDIVPTKRCRLHLDEDIDPQDLE